MTGDELDNYMKECSLYPDGTIRDASGKVVGGIDVDSETFKEIFEKNDIIGFIVE